MEGLPEECGDGANRSLRIHEEPMIVDVTGVESRGPGAENKTVTGTDFHEVSRAGGPR